MRDTETIDAELRLVPRAWRVAREMKCTPSMVQACCCAGCSGVAGCLLSELHARGESQFGVDVGEVGLHGAWRDEKPRSHVLVAQPFPD